jgi:hypothetical protein
MSRMTEVRGIFVKEAAEEVMVECYMKVSDNNQLPAKVRQIFYVARPLIEDRTDRPLGYGYFSQTLLPNYIEDHPECADWDVVYDDRGHFVEPHTKRIVGLGTLNVRNYLNSIGHLNLEDADFAGAEVTTCGPDGCFGALLYVEKEGFTPLFDRVRLEKRYDLAIMSCKGMSVIAARSLVDKLCGEWSIPLLVLHDFDAAGVLIRDTLENNTRRYTYRHAPTVIDLGLHYADIGDLTPEDYTSNISDERLEQAGLDLEAIEFLRDQRVELNAMTSRQLVDFVERKLTEQGISKVVPAPKTLTKTYQMLVKSERLRAAFEEVREELENEAAEPIEVPADLAVQVEKLLQERSDITWHRAVELVVDPDSADPEDDDEEDDDEAEDDENEDLSDIHE